MSRRPRIAASILVAFLATTAVPGSGVVAHRHGGGDHEHTHAFLAADHDDDHHHHDHRAHRHVRRHHHDHARLPRIARDHHDPLEHTHIASPFQPATPSDASLTLTASPIASTPATAVRAPHLRTIETVRSRGPPPSPLV
jgi:hypothetical protein